MSKVYTEVANWMEAKMKIAQVSSFILRFCYEEMKKKIESQKSTTGRNSRC